MPVDCSGLSGIATVEERLRSAGAGSARAPRVAVAKRADARRSIATGGAALDDLRERAFLILPAKVGSPKEAFPSESELTNMSGVLMQGELEKQSGGKKKGMTMTPRGISRKMSVGNMTAKWDTRYFVLSGARLEYYKSQVDCDACAICCWCRQPSPGGGT